MTSRSSSPVALIPAISHRYHPRRTIPPIAPIAEPTERVPDGRDHHRARRPRPERRIEPRDGADAPPGHQRLEPGHASEQPRAEPIPARHRRLSDGTCMMAQPVSNAELAELSRSDPIRAQQIRAEQISLRSRPPESADAVIDPEPSDPEIKLIDPHTGATCFRGRRFALDEAPAAIQQIAYRQIGYQPPSTLGDAA